MNEPGIIELYADGKEYGSITKEEIIEHYSMKTLYGITEEWSSACEYLSKYTDNSGNCRLDLRQFFNADKPDYCKTVAVCMMIMVLIDLERVKDIPPDILIGASPFLRARINEVQFAIIKHERIKKYNELVCREMEETLDNNGSLDECLDRLISLVPPVRNYANTDHEEKQQCLRTFELMQKAAKCCSTPYYTETIEEYIKALS